MSSIVPDATKLPVLGDSSAAPPPKFILRPLRFSDISTLAAQTSRAHNGNPVNHYLAPRLELYPGDHIRTFRQSIWRRAVNVRTISLVACLASDPDKPIGYCQHTRLGDDDGAKNQIQRTGRLNRCFLFILSWIIWVLFSTENWLWPDRSCDEDARKVFTESIAADSKKYWKPHPERSNRWHVGTLIVDPKWQGKGIGRLLLQEALSLAQEERVIVGLSASPAGEKLYRRMGFQLLGDFTFRIAGDVGGGIMIWYPEGMEETSKPK
ncbi:GNAT family acetyltransferas-like protein [Acephala macrosclerotiorum]|nr:GNAT family acetyltransferas-like protein [Acephala macrosclerotiorum]